MSNSHLEKKLYSEQYGFGTVSSPRETGFKFQRKQDPKIRAQVKSRQRNKKNTGISQKKCSLLYISPNFNLQKLNRSNSLTINSQNSKLLTPTVITFKSQSNLQQIKIENKQRSSEKNQIRTRTKTINDFRDSPFVQLEELKLNKKNLSDQIRELRLKIDHKDSLITKLEIQTNNKESKIGQLESKIKQFANKYRIAIEQNQEQRQTIENYQIAFMERQDQKKSVETRQDLQRILSDINRNFDQISMDLKLAEQSQINSQPKMEQVIINLHEKIKYQDIEIAMLKKNKYDFQKLKSEIEKLQVQNRILAKKVKAYSQKSQQEAKKSLICDYSILFDLSRDEDLRNG